MRISATLQGSADLKKRLAQLPQAVGVSVQRKALLTGAEPIRAAAAALAPRDSQSSGPHLADNIVIAVQTKTGLKQAGLSAAEEDMAGDGPVVEIGPSLKPSDHFYGYFQEYGTVHHPAQPFMRPAFDTKAQTSLALVMSLMWTAIRKALPESFGGRSTTGRAA